MWVRALLFSVLLGFWGSCLATADSQKLHLDLSKDNTGRQLLTLEAEAVSLSKLLHRIGKTTEIDIRLWQDIPDPVNASFEQRPVQEVFEALCSNFALVFAIDPDSGQYRIVGLDAQLETSEANGEPADKPDSLAKQHTGSGGTPQPIPASRERFKANSSKPPQHPAFVPGELLIRFAPHVSPETQQSLHDFLGSQVLKRLPSMDLDRIKLPGNLLEEEAIRLYKASGIVETAEKHALRYVQDTVPNDPEYSGQNWLQSIQTPRAWSLSQGDDEIVVAVIDTGANTLHPDLQANIWVNEQERLGEIGVDDDRNGYVDDLTGYDFADQDSDVSDVDGHGTHVAGIIGARGNNSLGVAGLNWRIRIMPLKVQQDASESIQDFDVIEALDYALDKGATIVNCSFGGELFTELEREAFVRVQATDALAVCAAGNDGLNIDISGNEVYPASYDLDSIISVAAADTDGSHQPDLADFSNFGPASVDLMAPGVNILSTAVSGQTTKADVQTGQTTIQANGLSFAGTTKAQGEGGLLMDCGYGYPEEIPQSMESNIALVQRGGIGDDQFFFSEKLDNVQTKGAEAAIIFNNKPGNFNGTLMYPGEDWIPAVSVSREDGLALQGHSGDEVRVVNQLLEDGSGYERMSGTSMATAVVSGALGLMQAWRLDMTPSELKQPLFEAVDPLEDVQSRLTTGGRLNVFAALADLVLPGDLNLNGAIGVDDAIVGLQLLTSDIGGAAKPWHLADVNKDGRIDAVEVNHVLRSLLLSSQP